MPLDQSKRADVAVVGEGMLWRGEEERDACGIGGVVALDGRSGRDIIELGLKGLCDLEQRGSGINDNGDGAGVTVRSHGLREFGQRYLIDGLHLPDKSPLSFGNLMIGEVAIGQNISAIISGIREVFTRNGFKVLGIRESTASEEKRRFGLDVNALGEDVRKIAPIGMQILFTNGEIPKEKETEALHRIKLEFSERWHNVHTVSLEQGTVTYKHMATGRQLVATYEDLRNPLFVSDAVITHRRFSTNTRSNPMLAQPFHHLAHNGEINTIGTLRKALRNLELSLRGGQTSLMRNGSDSGDVDRMVGLLISQQYSLPEALRSIFLPSRDDILSMPQEVQDYYKALRRVGGAMSAAEGPAGILALDEKYLVALMDGLGLRPLRFIKTRDDLLIFSSEIGAPYVDIGSIEETYQLDAGEMVIVIGGRILPPHEANKWLVEKTRLSYPALAKEGFWGLKSSEAEIWSVENCIKNFQRFGATTNDFKALEHIAKKGAEAIVGMGNNGQLAVFKNHPRLSDHLHQTVAVVTNPPMDPIREGAGMDLRTFLGRRPTMDKKRPGNYLPQPNFEVETPILSEEVFQSITSSEHILSTNLSMGVNMPDAQGMRQAINNLTDQALKIARTKEHSILILSDRDLTREQIHIPPILGVSAVHKALMESGLRRRVSLIVDSGDILNPHDVACNLAMGADAVNPYLVWHSAQAGLFGKEQDEKEKSRNNLMSGLVSSLKRVMSKMGITSIDGYRGSKLIKAVGLDSSLDYYLDTPIAPIGGRSLADLTEDLKYHNSRIVPHGNKIERALYTGKDVNGYDKSMREALMALAAKDGEINIKLDSFEAYLASIGMPIYLRDLLKLDYPSNKEASGAMDMEELIANGKQIIAKNIRGAAMSHGSLTFEAHRAVAGAFNEFGGWANTGEGGEWRERNPGGSMERDMSKIRQIGSARFGVDAKFLAHAQEIEIKIGQGAKPGEGGHLADLKVTPIIAGMRHTEVGVDLISPPPHHDLYSIEDLTRLIQDLRAINPEARIAVKITANQGIGTVAVGVAKAGADVIGISGWEGGTGAASLSAIEHTGLPLELGLAEIHQALTVSGIREAVVVRADGGIKSHEDIVKLACLGADEFSLGSALLVAGEKCIMCRSCSGQAKGVLAGTVSECPTGITSISPSASQQLGFGGAKLTPEQREQIDPETNYQLAKEGITNYLLALGVGVQRILNKLGKKSLAEIRGDVSLLREKTRRTGEPGAKISLAALLKNLSNDRPDLVLTSTNFQTGRLRQREADLRFNRDLLASVLKMKPELSELNFGKIDPENRSFGALLFGEVERKRVVLPEMGLTIKTEGYAGQSFGWQMIDGAKIIHEGFANDFVGAGQSGGMIVVKQPANVYNSTNSIAGNACAYGATGGKLFLGGTVGQRFGVRNSGAVLLAENVGKYAFEYMVRGIGLVVGNCNGQVGSGMTGGQLFLRKKEKLFSQLSTDVVTAKWTRESIKQLEDLLVEFSDATSSETVADLLRQGNLEESFQRVVPKEHFVNALTAYLTFAFYNPANGPTEEKVLGKALEELSSLKSDSPTLEEIAELEKKLIKLKKDFDANETLIILEPNMRFAEIKKWARQNIGKI